MQFSNLRLAFKSPDPNLAGCTCLNPNTLPGIFDHLLWIRNLRNTIFDFYNNPEK